MNYYSIQCSFKKNRLNQIIETQINHLLFLPQSNQIYLVINIAEDIIFNLLKSGTLTFSNSFKSLSRNQSKTNSNSTSESTSQTPTDFSDTGSETDSETGSQTVTSESNGLSNSDTESFATDSETGSQTVTETETYFSDTKSQTSSNKVQSFSIFHKTNNSFNL